MRWSAVRPRVPSTYLRGALSEPAAGEARQRVLAQLGWAEYLVHDRSSAVEHLTEALRSAQTADDRATLALRASRVLLVVGRRSIRGRGEDLRPRDPRALRTNSHRCGCGSKPS